MRVLVTGNMGYVGSVLVRHLRAKFPQAILIGFDSGYFAECLTVEDEPPESVLDQQIYGDVREFPTGLLEGVDSVVHLAAISNDSMGSRFVAPVEEINFRSSITIAAAARRSGVRSYVFASSCSLYGTANAEPRRETDVAEPLTAYARSKVAAEKSLQSLDPAEMTITCLRFATACGMSPRLRLDLVLNDFVACAIASRTITVLGDGTPWRPLIDVGDMALAIEWAITREPRNGGQFLSVNVGRDSNNWRVADLAQVVAKAVSGTRVEINADANPDRRSYRVDFSLFHALAPEFAPRMTVERSVACLYAGLNEMGFTDARFRESRLMRLNTLQALVAAGRLSGDLRWESTQVSRKRFAVS